MDVAEFDTIDELSVRHGVTAEEFATALGKSAGNVTHAAKLLSISRVHAIRLSRKFALRDMARNLRLDAGMSATGRPRKVAETVTHS